MMHHLYTQLSALQKIVDNIDCQKLEMLVQDALKTVKRGRKIIATALGKNVPICEKFIGTLLSAGISGYFLHASSALHGDLGAVNEGDLVILLSKSGETEETIYLYDYLLQKRVTIYLITYNKNSILAKLCPNTIFLYLEHEGDKWNLIPNNSTIGYLFILQAIAMELIEKLDIPLEVFKQNHPGGAIGKKLRGEL